MASNRAGETQTLQHQPRTDRFFTIQQQWFFSTREGSAIGPFTDREEASAGLNNLIEFMELANPKTLSHLHAALTV